MLSTADIAFVTQVAGNQSYFQVVGSQTTSINSQNGESAEKYAEFKQ
jgi:hypothetical protein